MDQKRRKEKKAKKKSKKEKKKEKKLQKKKNEFCKAKNKKAPESDDEVDDLIKGKEVMVRDPQTN